MRMRLLLAAMALAFVTASASAQVYINEYMSDPNNSAFTPAIFDSNLDGIGNSSEDEFVEIVNAGAVSVDIGNWTLADGAAVRHTFLMGTMLPAGGCIVVFGGGSVATFNAQGAGLGVTATGGFLGLNNGGDTITLADDMGMPVDVYTYTGSPSPDNGDGVSVVRDPEIPGAAFDQHNLVSQSGDRASPGFDIAGTAYAPATEMMFTYNYPGNGADVALEARVNGAIVSTLTGDVSLSLGDNFGFEISSPLGMLNNQGFALIYSIYTTGMAPAGIPLGGAGTPLDVWVDPFTLPTFVALDGLNPTGLLQPTISPFGFDFGPFEVPASVTGMSLSGIFQVFASAPGMGFPAGLGVSDAVALDLP